MEENVEARKEKAFSYISDSKRKKGAWQWSVVALHLKTKRDGIYMPLLKRFNAWNSFGEDEARNKET